MTQTIWTIGHSNRTIEVFLDLLAEHELEAIADVRRFPGSRRQPQFSQAALEATLRERGISYLWLPKLGGRRRPVADSPNGAWRNTSFRGYADHMATTEFAEGLADLLALAAERRTALMCAELLWWRCHRSLISDALRVRGMRVVHILDTHQSVEHPFTSPARVVDGQLTYQAD